MSKFLAILLTILIDSIHPTAEITQVIEANLVHGLGPTFECLAILMALVCMLIAEVAFKILFDRPVMYVVLEKWVLLLSLQNESVARIRWKNKIHH
jgi:hypothetical protein